MSVGAAVALGAVVGLALGVLLSVTTEVPLGPELGLVLGGVVGWPPDETGGKHGDSCCHDHDRTAEQPVRPGR